jgi:hypothetical protein
MDTSFQFSNRTRPTWMNQYFATSGNVPSAAFLDEIIQSELEAAADKRAQSAAIQLQQNRDEYTKQHDADVLAYTKQHDADLLAYNKDKDTTANNYADNALKRGTTNAWISGGASLLGTAAGLWGRQEKSNSDKSVGNTVSNVWDYLTGPTQQATQDLTGTDAETYTKMPENVNSIDYTSAENNYPSIFNTQEDYYGW